MTELAEALSALRRPKLLLDAARHGQSGYRRERDLGRLLRAPRLPAAPRAIAALLAEEDRMEEERRSGAGTYSLRRHVALLIALLAEARAFLAGWPGAEA
ncbi:MAG: hypothetical protein JKP98_06720 [Rhodobacteraceae bacterium]|jgi:hypothetical protein|nr:hypothetical protein [Paracoccaceae bacterium]MBL4556959.1 hypothetical protein [Paracoccaceae bacterium]HBG99039.1 hypothetical protein [Paracoccaceae bacterium]